MSILKTIAEKIKSSDQTNVQPAEKESAVNDLEGASLATIKVLRQIKLEGILSEIAHVVKVAAESKEKGQASVVKDDKKAKLGALLTRKKADAEAAPVEQPASKKDGEKVSKKKKTAAEIAAERAPQKKEQPVQQVAAAEPAPIEPQKEKGFLEGMIDMLKSLFLPIIALGGIGGFLSSVVGPILEGLMGGEEDGFFGKMIKTFKTIMVPVKWVFENVIQPVGAVILTALKEGLLGLGIAWKEAKLLLMSDNLLMAGFRKMLNIQVSDEEKKKLEKEVYEDKLKREQRMAGYVEKVTGKRPVTPLAAAAARKEAPPPTPTPAPPPTGLAPTPTVTAPAPTPAVQAAPPPPAARPPAPTPKPVAAAPAGPPPAPSIRPTEPTLKPAAPVTPPSGVQGVIVQALKESGITSTKAVANILATVKAESDFRPRSEDLTFKDPERIVAVYGAKRVGGVEGARQFVRNPEALANKVYATTDGNSAEGDGWKYRGRGFIQHTGKNQYKAISDFTGLDLIGNPDLLNDPGVAAKAIAWFFLKYKRLSVEQLDNMSAVNRAVAFSDPSGEKARAREQMAASYEKEISAGGGTMVAQAPSTGQAVNVASAEVNSEKNRPRQPTVNVTYVDATKVTTASRTTYS